MRRRRLRRAVRAHRPASALALRSLWQPRPRGTQLRPPTRGACTAGAAEPRTRIPAVSRRKGAPCDSPRPPHASQGRTAQPRRCGGPQRRATSTTLCFTAQRVAAARPETPIFVYTCWMWCSAVRDEMKSCAATSRAVRPSATRRSTSISRRLRPPGRSWRGIGLRRTRSIRRCAYRAASPRSSDAPACESSSVRLARLPLPSISPAVDRSLLPEEPAPR